MSTPLYPPTRPLSVGEVLDLSFRIYRATLVRSLPIAALALIASQLPTLYLLVSGRGLMRSMLVTMQDPVYRIVYFVGVLLSLVMHAALLLRVYRLISGGEAGGEVAAGARRLLALVLFVFLFGLVFVACAVPMLLVMAGVSKVLAGLLCLLAAAYVMVALSVAFVVMVVEGATPQASLRRSWALTRGSFWRLSMIYTVALLMLFVLYILLGVASSFLVALAVHADVAVFTAAYAVIVVVLGTVAVPFYAAVQLAVLGDLTVRREGADIAQRTASTA